MKYVIYNGHAITHKLVDKSAVRPLMKANPNHRLDTDGGESGPPTGYSEGSILIKTTEVPTVFIRSRQDDAESSAVKPKLESDPYHKSYVKVFSPPQENGEQITV